MTPAAQPPRATIQQAPPGKPGPANTLSWQPESGEVLFCLVLMSGIRVRRLGFQGCWSGLASKKWSTAAAPGWWDGQSLENSTRSVADRTRYQRTV